MRNLLLAVITTTLISGIATGKDNASFLQTVKFQPYGFIRNYAIYDSRATKSLTEDLFFFMPLDKEIKNGTDVNAVGSYNFQALTTRLGLNITGYKIKNLGIDAKIEGDFYCLNSTKNTATFRMRLAYFQLNRDFTKGKYHTSLKLTIGQTWHPLANDKPYGINLESGTPFTPFNRSPQIRLTASINNSICLTGSILQQMQYRSMGPQKSTNLYQRHSIPEFYGGISFKASGITAKTGIDILSIRPHYGYNENGKKYNEQITTISPFIYIQYEYKSLKINAKTVLAEAGEHMQLNSGYAITGKKEDGISNEYTPIRSSVSFLSVKYGRKLQIMGMIGYHKTLGTSKPIENPKRNIYFSGNGFKEINSILRFTPTIIYNLGKFQIGLEYNYTMVEYGKSLSKKLIPQDCHWIGNHRLILCTKFEF